ncbi:flagellar basal-body rod protein FlgF [Candidatus Magnetominusculus xianensis]|uniref:Flagellar basal body rod protein FlgG n=1 Tax=Candidatus Magnetominusculus xianensis TaxID=1748249 RepID=A0ABR5SF70_9BACT|nr:flagellar basal-body rod protein FlgF [Candidatus Magnetominusculus xianensis]KWT85392.1 flagellar basal body rod protein FlgG [Candidatus Magnetominusculus xianensis]MBF0405129.1 flagellar basal-body rod protein FlgF [Nitrospirota bacterium]
MYKGSYIAASGMVVKQRQMELVSNNLANTTTFGYKQDRVSFRDVYISEINGVQQQGDPRDMTYTDVYYTDHSEGAFQSTGNPLDVAIGGRGYFSVEGNKYTRAGNFTLDVEGYIVTKTGDKVLGSSGPIQIQTGNVQDIQIGSDGTISVDGTIIDTLSVVDFPDTKNVIKQGNNFFVSTDQPVESTATVNQGHIEFSNVNVIQEMVTMIELLREYESQQKVVQAFDDATSKVTNDMARL